MKFTSLLSFICLSVFTSGSDVTRSNIEGNQKERNLATYGDLGDQGIPEDCSSIQNYDREVSLRESTDFFGQGEGRIVDGPISSIARNSRGSKISLQSNPPDLPAKLVGNKDQTVAIGGRVFLPNLTDGSRTCPSDRIVTEVQCKRRDCGSLRLKCEALNTELYKMDDRIVETSFTSSNIKIAKCPKSYYMVGMECDAGGGNSCNSFRLRCAKINFKIERDCGIGDDVPPPPQCTDLTISGQSWKDRDNQGCINYTNNSGWCRKYGAGYRNVYTANEACCSCGGGST